MIKVEQLTKRFGAVTAVDDLSFEVAKGDVLGFLGPNGAGKTTTMRILTGFVPPTSGRVSVAGYDVFDDPIEVKRRVGYLPESVPVYPDMIVKDYLEFVTDLKGLEKRERKRFVEAAMERTDISDRRNRIIGHLSKGYRKRVGIAQALLGHPEVLILDEPTEGLDPNQVVSIRELVTALAGDRTVIVSTHILSEVEQTCSRVLIIDRGRRVAADTVANIRATARGHEAHVELTVRGSAEAAKACLSPLASVAEVAVTGAEEGHTRLSVTLRAADGSEEIASAIVGAGMGLLEMRRERVRLEDVFVRLTRAQPAVGDSE